MLGLLGFGLYQPVLTRVKGYFKTYFVNLGESLPKGVSDDWRTLIMNRKSVNRLLEKTENFSKIYIKRFYISTCKMMIGLQKRNETAHERNLCQYETYLQNRASSRKQW